MSVYHHLVLVNGVEINPDGSGKLKVWDGNFFAESLKKSPKEIEVSSKGEFFYQPWIEPNTPTENISTQLSRVALAPENDLETIQQIYALSKFCRSQGELCKLTKMLNP